MGYWGGPEAAPTILYKGLTLKFSNVVIKISEDTEIFPNFPIPHLITIQNM